MKAKKLIPILAAVLVLGACGNDAGKTKEENKNEQTKIEDTQKAENKGVKEVENTKKDDDEKPLRDADRDPIPQVATNPDEAMRIFHEHRFGDGSAESINISKLKLTFFNEALDYEIEGFKDGKKYKLKIADNGEILEEEIEDDDDTNKLALDGDKIITATDAMEKALEGQPENAWVVEYELEIDDGRAVYDIDIENGDDVKIDAVTGEIIK